MLWQASARQTWITWRPGRLAAEIVIEADHALDFRAREIEHVGDDHHRLVADVAEMVVERVQDRDQRTLDFLELERNRAGLVRVPTVPPRSLLNMSDSRGQKRHSYSHKYRDCPCLIGFRVLILEYHSNYMILRENKEGIVENQDRIAPGKRHERQIASLAIETASSVGAEIVTSMGMRASTAFCTSS